MTMRKKFLGIALAITAIISGTAYAQNQNDASQKQVQTECNKKSKENKKGKKDKKDKKEKGDKKTKASKEGKSMKERKADKQAFNPFEGIQLTTEQQQKLQSLKQSMAIAKPEKKAQEGRKKDLTEEQKKQLKAEAKNKKAEMKAKKAEAKKTYLAGVKEVLTPQQYTLFLENIYLKSPQGNFKGGKGKMNKSRA